MPQWLLILGAAFAGGLLVLHAFGKAKSVNDYMLDTYRDFLDQASRSTDDDRNRRDTRKPPAPEADETAPPV